MALFHTVVKLREMFWLSRRSEGGNCLEIDTINTERKDDNNVTPHVFQSRILQDCQVTHGLAWNTSSTRRLMSCQELRAPQMTSLVEVQLRTFKRIHDQGV